MNSPRCEGYFFSHMMQYLPELFTVAVIHLLAAMAPGPDLVMISRNSLVYSRRAGVFSALGLMFGLMVHIAYSLAGIGFLIAHSIVLYTSVKWIGALYLIFIGIQSLRAKKKKQTVLHVQEKKDIAPFMALKMGFLTNVLNPKATLFFLALFSQIIDPTTPLFVQLLYGIEMSAMQFIWFSSVAYMLSTQRVKAVFMRSQVYIEKTMGAVLVALGIKIALTDSH